MDSAFTDSMRAASCTLAEWRPAALAALLVLIVSPAAALQVEDLYTARVLVADESPAQLRSGARAGLLQDAALDLAAVGTQD